MGAEAACGEAAWGDVRRPARRVQLATLLGAPPSASLPAAVDEAATWKAADRFFDHDHIHADAILASPVHATTARRPAVPRVLAVHATP